LLDRFRTLLGGGTSRTTPEASDGNVRPLGDPICRPSNGLDQFFASLRDRTALTVLDFAGASQENVSFITSMGHRLSSEDFVRSIEQTFGPAGSDNQSDPLLVDQFIAENLTFQPDNFDGALVWDALQFLSPHLLQLTIDRLYDTLRPGAYLFAFFNADDKAKQIPLFHHRIVDQKTLMLAPRGYRQPVQFFNNRAIEKLFHRFQSVKFFLARDSLREIIVRR
jgi:hypothetical protein